MGIVKIIKKGIRRFLYLLPHNLAFNSYKLLNKKSFNDIQQLRKNKIEIDTASYKQFDDYKCIFVHIPKTAGVSLNKAIFGNLGGAHTKLINYRFIFNKKEFNSYFKFAFVRNPWDRLVSAYFFLKEGGFNKADKEFYINELEKYNDFNDFVIKWINTKNINRWIHFIPQYKFVCIRDKIAVDKIYKVEEIDHAVLDIKQKLDLDFDLKQDNKTKNRKKNYRMYYNEQTRKIVYSVYFKDITMFKYMF